MGKRQRVRLYLHPTDQMNDLTICRNCGKVCQYGKVINCTGHDACPDCYETLYHNIRKIKEQDYESYKKMDHFYLMPFDKYKERCITLLKKQHEFLDKEEKKIEEEVK